MRTRVGLTTSDLKKLVHRYADVSCLEPFTVSVLDEQGNVQSTLKMSPGEQIHVTAQKNVLNVSPAKLPGLKVGSVISIAAGSAALVVESVTRQGAAHSSKPHYKGTLEIRAEKDQVRIILSTSLEDYIKGVLQSEIPASYHLEAIKAQAVAARTYALHPRIDHTNDACTVCDSYLCCQYFAGAQAISARHSQAIAETEGQILTYDGKPILALFSSNAGGCTEDFQNCFSDPTTNAFPPTPLPYLKSALEKEFEPNRSSLTEADLRAIWADKSYSSADSWSSHFRWHVQIKASSLEAEMHHQIELLCADPATAPFIVPAPSGKFGHINSFEITKRGRSGTAIELSIHTSSGAWMVKKELVIRSAFKNDDLKLARLSSAKLFFDHSKDALGLLASVSISGLGWGHGVGLQQTGAQGWALRGKNYEDILAHYFEHAFITK